MGRVHLDSVHSTERTKTLMWKHTGKHRPAFAEAPGPGQESVWDYPRPPVLEPSGERVQIGDSIALIADTQHALRVLETASPPSVGSTPTPPPRSQRFIVTCRFIRVGSRVSSMESAYAPSPGSAMAAGSQIGS